jgi:3-oxoacyl-(acyl-carrier-protein) synthase
MTNFKKDNDRVVITGMGIVTTIGQTLEEYYHSLMAGKSGITQWKHMDSKCLSKIGGDLTGFDLKKHFESYQQLYPDRYRSKAFKLFRNTPFAGTLTGVASLQAFLDAGLNDSPYDPTRFGHVLGGHNLNANFTYQNTLIYQDEPDYIEPLYGLLFLDTDVLAVVNDLLICQGPSSTVGGACASSNIALINGLDVIRSGRADLMLVSGGACDVDPLCLQGWGMMDALSYRSFNGEPQQASRPFDAKREGFVPGQSTGAVILERLSHAKKRKAMIYGEILGGAYNSDASRLTKPDVNGQTRAIKGALEDAHVSVDEIDYVNAHATSTPLGDLIEINALKKAFGERAYQIPINSTKSMIGHCLLSASIVELIASVLQMKYKTVHPTINQEEKDPELDLDFVPNQGREHVIRNFLSNSFGFGGINSSIIGGVLT